MRDNKSFECSRDLYWVRVAYVGIPGVGRLIWRGSSTPAFGIQSRAGCSCAAPYGHRLLHIDAKKSRELKKTIRLGNIGLKPG